MTTGKQLQRSATMKRRPSRSAPRTAPQLGVAVRVSDDGVAYRYLLDGKAPVTVTGEASTFELPTQAKAWVQPYSPSYETERTETTAGAANAAQPSTCTGDTCSFGYPTLFEAGSTYVLLTEADVDGRYSGSHLDHPTAAARTPSRWRRRARHLGRAAVDAVAHRDRGHSGHRGRLDPRGRPRAAVEAQGHLVDTAGRGRLVVAEQRVQPRGLRPAEGLRRLRGRTRTAVHARGRRMAGELGAGAGPLRAGQGRRRDPVVRLDRPEDPAAARHLVPEAQGVGRRGGQGRLHGLRLQSTFQWYDAILHDTPSSS